MSADEFRLLIVAILAVYRLAYMTTADSGPAHIFVRFRSWVYHRFGGGSWQYEGASCFFCQSVWFAALALLAFPWPGLARAALLWLGIAGGAQALHWLVLTFTVQVEKA